MKKIYAPWRADYVTKEARSKNETTKADECVFCTQFEANDDEKYFIIKRAAHAAIMMNFYPYNAGHLMVLPYEHKASLTECEAEVRTEIMELITLSVEVLSSELNSGGFNIGMNLGKAAGAGIPSHIHMHVIPRWEGDTNFFPLIAKTKAVSFDLEKMYVQLRAAFDKAR